MAGVPGRGGKKGRSGRKPKAVEDDLHERLRAALRDGRKSKLDEVFGTLVADALSKSFTVRHKARTQLLAYLYGTPIPRVAAEPEREDNLAPPIADAIDRIYGDGNTGAGG